MASLPSDEPITREEYEMISDMMKKEEFRKLFYDYCEELNDPENKKLYEEELTQFEKERGVDITFINPEPGFSIKTSVDGVKKCFINVAQSDKVEKPSFETEINGTRWKIPFTQAPPRSDYDKKKNACVVYDVVFHTDAITMADSDKRFRKLLIETALDGVQNSFDVNIDRNNLKYPKLKFKGLCQPTIIRKRSEVPVEYEESPLDKISPPIPSETAEMPKLSKSRPKMESECEYTIPKYKIVQRHDVDIQECVDTKDSKMNVTIPKELVITIFLPLLRTTEDANLDVTDKELYIISEHPSKYKLRINLPYPVDESEGHATFDKANKKLIVTLPVKQKENFPRVNRYSVQTVERDDVKIEEISSTIFSSDDTLVDNSEHGEKSPFLDPTIAYLLPPIRPTLTNQLRIAIELKNIDPTSVKINKHLEVGFHVKFCILGTGFFPIHYALCIMLSQPIKLVLMDQQLDNDCLLLNFEIPNEIRDDLKLYAGLVEDDLMEYEI